MACNSTAEYPAVNGKVVRSNRTMPAWKCIAMMNAKNIGEIDSQIK